MKNYKIKITGTTPLLFNVRQREIDKELKSVKKDELDQWEEDNWPRKAECNDDGHVIIPDRWLKAAFIASCKGTMMVPNFATSKKQTYTKYSQSLFFKNVTFRIKVKDLTPYGVFVGAQGANSKTKVWRIRPKVDSWSTEFEIVDPFGRMKDAELKELMDYMGVIVGIGDGRSLNFGRFETNSIKEL